MVARGRTLLIFCLFLTVQSITACERGAPAGSAPVHERATRYEGGEPPQIKRLIDSNTVKLLAIKAAVEKMEQATPFGEIVTVVVENLSREPQYFRIDCGTVLRAADALYQDLVVSRSAEATVAAGAQWQGKLEVFSLQMRRHYAYQPAQYVLGNIAGGQLREFTECFCFRRPGAGEEASGGGGLDLTPAQYAVWRIVDNVTLRQLLEYARARGNPSIDEMAIVEERAREQGRFTEQLLEDCRITVKFLD